MMYIADFKHDLVQIILAMFKHYEVKYFDPDEPPVFMDKRCQKFVNIFGKYPRDRILLRQYLNFKEKFLHPYPWKIEISSKLTGYESRVYGDKLQFFIERAKSGKELHGFLSKGSAVAYDEDGLLNCWSLHHAHLSDQLEDEGKFYKRSDYLLMLHQTKDTLCLVDVVPHTDKAKEPSTGKMVNLAFARSGLIETLIREFSEVAKNWKLEGVLGISEKIDDFGHQSLRHSGIQTMIEVDGVVYAPGHGITTASTGVKITMHSDQLMRMLSAWEDYLREHHEQIILSTGLWPDVLRPALLRLHLTSHGFLVYELRSKNYLWELSQQRYFRKLRC
jgi:hypothetical protein